MDLRLLTWLTLLTFDIVFFHFSLEVSCEVVEKIERGVEVRELQATTFHRKHITMSQLWWICGCSLEQRTCCWHHRLPSSKRSRRPRSNGVSTEYQNVTITQHDWEMGADEMDLNAMAVHKLILCKYLECHGTTPVVKQVVDVPVIKQVTVPTVQTVERVVEAGL